VRDAAGPWTVTAESAAGDLVEVELELYLPMLDSNDTYV
jgi:hypothetical protein